MDLYTDPNFNPLERQYNLRARVKVVRGKTQQGIKGGETEFQAVILLLQDCDETTKFFGAWLPDDEDHRVECLAIMGRPVYGGCRMSVLRASKHYPEGPHLFVMTKAVEDALIHREDQLIEFKVEPSLKDADKAHESDFADTTVAIDKV